MMVLRKYSPFWVLFSFMLDSAGYALRWALASRRFSDAVPCHSLFMIVYFEHNFE